MWIGEGSQDRTPSRFPNTSLPLPCAAGNPFSPAALTPAPELGPWPLPAVPSALEVSGLRGSVGVPHACLSALCLSRSPPWPVRPLRFHGTPSSPRTCARMVRPRPQGLSSPKSPSRDLREGDRGCLRPGCQFGLRACPGLWAAAARRTRSSLRAGWVGSTPTGAGQGLSHPVARPHARGVCWSQPHLAES